MVRRTLWLGLAGVAIASCTPTMTPQERALEEQVVKDRTNSWIRTYNNRDRDSLATFYLQTPELTVAWPGARTSGWEEEAAAHQEYFRGVSTLNLVAQDLRVEVLASNVAVATFRHSTDEIHGTERDLYAGNGTLVWVKPAPEAVWVIRAAQISRTPAPAEAPRRR